MPVLTQTCNAQTSNSTFSIIWITDTQYLSESYPEDYANLCSWITQNRDTYNIQMVVHTGDIVNEEGNTTQWIHANQSMGILADADIPYCWNAGNHDYNSTCWIGNQFTMFNPQTFQSNPCWVSSFQDGMNTAVAFNASGHQWLIVNLAFYANDSALAWANGLLDAYSDANAIVAAHAYINRQCQYDSWATNLKSTVLDTHPSVFLTLSGHIHPTAGNRTRVGGRDELLFNQQDAEGQQGAESARILTFNTADGAIRVQTYNLYTNQFVHDGNNNFTLNTTFRNYGPANSSLSFLTVAALAIAVLCLVLVALLILRWRFRQ
jgi:3',5'-cyclic AMP phosphodiesterase CpdA